MLTTMRPHGINADMHKAITIMHMHITQRGIKLIVNSIIYEHNACSFVSILGHASNYM